nr:hypothetical protein, conserved [Leishmania guyanensis]
MEKIPVVINVTDDWSRDSCTFLKTGESSDAHAVDCVSAQESAGGTGLFSSGGSASVASPAVERHVSARAPAPMPCVPVPPSATPVRQFKSLYDQSMHLPPGTTKRALGRLRIVWCCVVTAESWHAVFVGAPILFFATLFVTVVVPRGEWLTYLFTAFFTATSVTCLILSVTLDPGIIPPASQSQQPAEPAVVLVSGKPVVCKVCPTCHILRPPRSTHCQFCDVCVEEFDHHCSILGSCVGKRTFRFFGGFFIMTSFLALYVLIRSFITVVTTDFTLANDQSHLIWLAASCILCIFAAIIGAILVIPCAARYVMLSATNSTVKETMRTQQQSPSGKQAGGCLPAAEMRIDNYCLSLVRRLFSPIGRSRIPFDYYV